VGGQPDGNFCHPLRFEFVCSHAPEYQCAFPTRLLIFYGIFMILCGLSAGILGLVAVIRSRERSWLVWLSILPLLFVLFLLLGEFLGSPH
jgi:hypothetical protein